MELVPPAGTEVVAATLDGKPVQVVRRGALAVVRTGPLDPSRPAVLRLRLGGASGT